MTFFEKIITPLNSQDFFSEYWDEKVKLIHRNSENFYDNILKSEQVAKVLNSNDLYYPLLRVAKAGEYLDYKSYTLQKYGDDKRIDIEKLYNYFGEGYSIIMTFMNYRIDSLNSFINSLSCELKMKTFSNLYLTPPYSQGFPAHFDGHNVLVLQIEGKKEWEIYDTVKKLPLPNRALNIDEKSMIPAQKIVLNPGDLLYIPRGVIHKATTKTESSLHITLSFFPTLWYDIFNQTLDSIKDTKAFNQEVYPFSKSHENFIKEINHRKSIIINTLKSKLNNSLNHENRN